MPRLVLVLVGLLVASTTGAGVVSSVLADARMLVDVLGPFGFALYLVVPSLVAPRARYVPRR